MFYTSHKLFVILCFSKLDKKFSWLNFQQSSSVAEEETTSIDKRWLTAGQIADIEKEPVDGAYMKMLLESLPSRKHRRAALATAGVMEYEYDQESECMNMTKTESFSVQRGGGLKQGGFKTQPVRKLLLQSTACLVFTCLLLVIK
jgi:hypothetical protein